MWEEKRTNKQNIYKHSANENDKIEFDQMKCGCVDPLDEWKPFLPIEHRSRLIY